jgi:TP901 family phage tail tape measure protein
MATGGNMVKLVVQLLADAKNFASELDKSVKAVDDAAKEMSKDLETVSTAIAEETTKAVKDIETTLDTTATDVKKTAEEVEKAVVSSTEDSVKARIDAEGRLRDTKSKFLKKGSAEYEAAMAQMKTTSTRTTGSILRDFTMLGIGLGVAVVKGAGKAITVIQDMANKIGQDMSRLGATLARWGGALSGAVTLGLGGAAKSAAAFEKGMAQVISLLDKKDRTPAFIETLRRGVDELAVKFGVTAPDAIAAMYDAISTGVAPAKVLDFLTLSAKGAVGGVSTLADSSSYLASVMNAYGLKSADAAEQQQMLTDAMDLTFQAIKIGKTTFPELSKQISDVAPLAAQAGVSIKDLTAAIATITLTGKPTPQTMTAIKAALIGLGMQEKNSIETAEALGISWDLNSLKTKGLQKFVEDLRVALEKNGKTMNVYKTKVDKNGKVTKVLDFTTKGVVETMVKLAGSSEAATAWLALMSDNGQLLAGSMEGANNATGSLNDATQALMENDPTFQWRQAWQALAATFRDVGRAVLGYLKPIIPTILEVIMHVQQWAAANGEFLALLVAGAAGVGTFGTAITALGLALMFAGGVLTAIATIGLPFLVAGIGVILPFLAILATAIAFVVTNFSELKNWAMTNWPAIRNVVVTSAQAIWASLKTVGQQVFDALKISGQGLTDWLKTSLPTLLAWIQQATNWIATVFIPAFGKFALWVIAKFKAMFAYLRDNWPQIVEIVKAAAKAMSEAFLLVVDIVKQLIDVVGAMWVKMAEYGTLDKMAKSLRAIGVIFKGVRMAIDSVITSLTDLFNKMEAFRKDSSLINFMKLLLKLISMAPNPAVPMSLFKALSGSGGGGATTAVTSSSRMLPASAAATLSRGNLATSVASMGAPPVVNNHYQATVYQQTNESADELLNRLARKLQQKRGR